jgi:hypothetical protein
MLNPKISKTIKTYLSFVILFDYEISNFIGLKNEDCASLYHNIPKNHNHLFINTQLVFVKYFDFIESIITNIFGKFTDYRFYMVSPIRKLKIKELIKMSEMEVNK